MEIHQLKYFVEVARTGNFTRAAARCNVTQPTLSHQIRKLEEELGEPLLQRRKKGNAPTPFGDQFLKRARVILREVELAKEEATAFSTEVRGLLRLGAIPTIAPYLLPGLLRQASASYPQLQFKVYEEPTDELLRLLRRGALDLAVVSPPIEGGEWRLQHLADDELLATLPVGHPLVEASEVSLEALAANPLVLMKEAHCLRGQALKLCERSNQSPEISIQSSQLDTVLAMVELGLGLSLTPKLAVPFLSSRKVVYRSLSPQPQFRSLALIWPQQASQTKAFRAFLDLAGARSRVG